MGGAHVKISITLPTLHLDCVERTLQNLENSTTGHQYEALVCAPFRIEERETRRGSVVWIEDVERSGCVAAHRAASLRATGDFITAFADDHSYALAWDVIAIEDFLLSEARNAGKYGPTSLGLRQVSESPHVGTMFGIYYPYFPLMRLRDAQSIGGWYDSSRYRNGFSDPDLGMRVWASGGICWWAEVATVITRPEDQARKGPPNYLEDAETFLSYWYLSYGSGWETDFVRQWDLDVPLGTFGVGERTCFMDQRVKNYVSKKDA